jgi:hypothetical protein
MNSPLEIREVRLRGLQRRDFPERTRMMQIRPIRAPGRATRMNSPQQPHEVRLRGLHPQARLRAAVWVAAMLIASPLGAQERPATTAGVQPFVAVDAPVVALTHVRLVDGTGAPARDDQTVVVSGTRILAVGPSASMPVPAGARVLELAGHTVIPGIVGLHEHTYFGGLGQTLPMNAGAYLYLAFGVTTAMTAGSQLPDQEVALKRAVDAGEMPGPRLLIAGPYITGGNRRTGPFRGVDSPEEARRFVDEWAGKGATWFKVMSGPGDALRWTIEAAHARGLRVTGHLCAVTFTEAAAMGIDALQHGFITNSEYVPGRQPDSARAATRWPRRTWTSPARWCRRASAASSPAERRPSARWASTKPSSPAGRWTRARWRCWPPTRAARSIRRTPRWRNRPSSSPSGC